MSIILAIEASTDMASVALHYGSSTPGPTSTGCDGQQLSRQTSGVRTHSQTVLPMVQALLAEANIALSRCEVIAFGAGPGSFTGVRTACAIAQGLAYGSDLPVVAVDTLAATALLCGLELARTMPGATAVDYADVDCAITNDILVAFDARMGQVYWGQYRWPQAVVGVPGGASASIARAGSVSRCLGSLWEVVRAPQLSSPAAVLPVGAVTLCGNGFAVHEQAFQEALAPIPVLWQRANAHGFAMMPHATQIAFIGEQLFAAGMAVAPRDAQPFYLRNDVALTTAERARKTLETVT